MILSAEQVCRLFRYRSGACSTSLGRFISNTPIQLITNIQPFHAYPVYCSHPVIFLLQGRYFKGIVIPVNSSLHPSKYPPMFNYFFFSKPTSGAFYTKVLFHAFGNKDFVNYSLLFFSSVKIFIVTKIFF